MNLEGSSGALGEMNIKTDIKCQDFLSSDISLSADIPLNPQIP